MDNVKLKVQKEVKNINLLKETVKKSSQLTKGMCTILSSFDDRLMKLERTILPVYHETGNLQRRQENIEKTLAQLEEVVQLYSVSKCVGPIVQKGPGDNLTDFIAAVEKIQQAIDYFEKNNPSHSEAAILQSLFLAGSSNLQTEFENLLSRHSKPVPPVVLLDLVDDIGQAPEQLPCKVVEALAMIASWLRKNGADSQHLDKYVEVRSRILFRSIQGLREHQKACSGNSATLLHGSPQLGSRKSRETPPRRVSRKFQEAILRGLKRSDTSLASEPKEEIVEQEVEGYLTLLTAVCRLAQAEHELLRTVVGRTDGKLLEKVLLPALESVTSEGEGLAGRVKRCVARHDFLNVLCLFPVLQHIRSLREEYDATFNLAEGDAGRKLPTLAVTLQTTLNKALEELVDSVKNDPDTKMPRDGTVHELTSNVMMVLEHLLGFVDSAGAVLAISDVVSFTQSRDPNRAALAQFVTRVLSALGLALLNKSTKYEDAALQAVFRLNNFHYVLRALQKSGLLDVVHSYEPALGQQYEDNVRDQKRLYSQSWSRVLHYVLEVDRPLSPGAKLKDKDRQSIKDKFTGFNKELEEMFRVQKAYAVPDVELREALKRDNKEFILPKYKIFYDKYAAVPFTKNPEKYLKYSPLDVSNLIDRFFDAAA